MFEILGQLQEKPSDLELQQKRQSLVDALIEFRAIEFPALSARAHPESISKVVLRAVSSARVRHCKYTTNKCRLKGEQRVLFLQETSVIFYHPVLILFNKLTRVTRRMTSVCAYFSRSDNKAELTMEIFFFPPKWLIVVIGRI